MRRFYAAAISCLLAFSGCAMAQLNMNSNPDDVLDALHASGQSIKSFSATLKLNEFDDGTGAETNRFGKVWFQIKADGEPVMHVVFDQKQVNDKKSIPDKVEYLLDDGWVTNRTDATKTESRMQVVPKGEKMNLFQVGKSPFPMPIGQDRAEVEKQFDVSKVAPVNDDPPGTIHLLLTPKPNSPLAKQFSSVDLWTDVKTRMPVRIKTIDSKKAKERTTDLTDLKVNPNLNPQDVSVSKLPPDWRTSDTPLTEKAEN